MAHSNGVSGKSRFKSRVATVSVAVMLTMAFTGLNARETRAASIWAQGGATVINVHTDSKNYGNHTQYVNYISVVSGRSNGCGFYEAWAQGFYASGTSCTGITWYINRWVPSGSNVCGAITYWAGGPREIACITIRV